MKFTCKLAELKKALSRLSFLPGGNAADIISGNLYIEAGLDGLTMKRRSASANLVCGWDSEIAREGETVIPFEKFRRFIDNDGGDEIAVELKPGFLCVEAGGSAKFPVIPDAEFTDLPFTGGEELAAPAESWIDWLAAILPACATKERARPNLEGVIIRKIDGHVWLTGADGRRVHVIVTPFENAIEAIIPAETSAVLGNLAKTEEGATAVALAFSENLLCYKTPTVQLVSVLSAETVGNFAEMLRQKGAPLVTVAREAAIAVARSAGNFVNDQLDPITLRVKKKSITFFGSDTTGHAFQKTLEAKGSQERDVSFNWDYLTDALAACRETDVAIDLVESGKSLGIVIRENDRIISLAAVYHQEAAK